ncbi:hypothetical protein [Rufibacter sp. XAAS-G3-1]
MKEIMHRKEGIEASRLLWSVAVRVPVQEAIKIQVPGFEPWRNLEG